MADTSFTAQQTTILAAWLNQVNLAIFQGRSPNVGTTTGSANAQVLTLATGSLYTSRTAGDTFGFIAGYTNAAAATLQIVAPSGTLAAAALELNGAALTGGEVIAGQPYVVMWDGTAWQLASLAGTAFGTSLLQAVDAAAGRTVLGAAASYNTLLTGNLALSSFNTPAQITAQQNNYSVPADVTILRLSANSAQSITGFNATANGRVLIHENVGNQVITLTANSAASDANFRITAGANIALAENDVAMTLYDPTAQRHVPLVQPANGSFRTMQVFTSTGANTWTKPSGLKRARVTVVGAGGGGGACPATGGGEFASSAGGGGGGVSIKVIAAESLGSTETATVGAGGPGGSAGANGGTAGGTSSFGAHCSATGGNGGNAGANAGSGNNTGTTGGIGSGGDINGRGGSATSANWYSGGSILTGSNGGDSFLGGGGAFPANDQPASAGGAYGGGASGVAISSSQPARAGAAGANGIIIVEEFF